MTSLIDMTPVMALLAFESLTVTRSTSSFNSQGVLVVAAPSTFSLACNAQPLSGKDLQRLPEAQRTRGGLVVFSAAQLQIATSPGTQSDSVTFRGQVYTVVASEQWDSESYWRSILVKAEV